MYVRIPSKIDIIGVTYDVEYVKAFSDGRVAQIDFRGNKIQIMKELGDNVTFVSFMHELTHGVFVSLNIYENETIFLNEDMIERMSQIYSQIFKQILKYNLDPEYIDKLLYDELDEICETNLDDVKVELETDMMIS